MKFPWDKYIELPLSSRNTLQIFITNRCNCVCNGCFARNVMVDDQDISLSEYRTAIATAVSKGVKQINLLGGEPFLHPQIYDLIEINNCTNLKTTIYTNGTLLHKIDVDRLGEAKLRVSIYSLEGSKGINLLPGYDSRLTFDANFMIHSETTVDEMLEVARVAEEVHCCKVFFIFSMRELENSEKEFFCDNQYTGSILGYKKIVHSFLTQYPGNMDIHVSKRGVFESTTSIPRNRCCFANYFIGGKIIQCPYDVVNTAYQQDYDFDVRNCQHNTTCLMSKVIYRKKSAGEL